MATSVFFRPETVPEFKESVYLPDFANKYPLRDVNFVVMSAVALRS